MRTTFWLLPQVSWLNDNAMRRMQAAYSLSFAACAQDWNIEAPGVKLASRAGDIPDSGWPMVFSDTIDQPGDLAYHTYLDGRPYSIVLSNQAQMSLADVEEAGNHEGKEMICDPGVDQYVYLPNGDRVAREVSDPGQNQRIPIDLGSGEPVQTSNHVTPAWFNPLAPPDARLDAAGMCPTPLLIGPDGYAMLVSVGGNVKIHGPGIIGYSPEMAMSHLPNDACLSIAGNYGPSKTKAHPVFRYGKRLVHMHSMAASIRALQ